MKALVTCIVLTLSHCDTHMPPAPSTAQAKQFQCMLTNIYHEARGDTEQGMQAVALVTLNRARQQGKTVCEIVYQRKQFSWTMMPKLRRKPLVDNYDRVHRVASAAMSGDIDDFTGGATHYHTKTIKPYWAKTLKKIKSFGAHIFYKGKQND